jgi:hypothetical protein
MLPVTVAHHVKILTISFLIVLRIAFLNLDNVSRLRTERLRLFHSLTVAETKESLLTKGSDLLTYEENITIFKHAFKYIKDSKRFTIV